MKKLILSLSMIFIVSVGYADSSDPILKYQMPNDIEKEITEMVYKVEYKNLGSKYKNDSIRKEKAEIITENTFMLNELGHDGYGKYMTKEQWNGFIKRFADYLYVQLKNSPHNEYGDEYTRKIADCLAEHEFNGGHIKRFGGGGTHITFREIEMRCVRD